MQRQADYIAIVIGASAGGLQAFSELLPGMPANYKIPVIIAQHRSKDERELLEELLRRRCRIAVKQADEKENIKAGNVYIAPPDYHLLIEENKTFSLSSDPPVKFSRPSIDVLFECAAQVYGEQVVGIILTGANDDGANGIRAIHSVGGLTIAQNTKEALHPVMPTASIQTGCVKRIFSLKEIQQFMIQIGAT